MEGISINISDDLSNKPMKSPNLNVLGKSDIGVLNINEIGLSPKKLSVSPKKVNFGPGAEMLMNNKKRSTENLKNKNIDINDINVLDNLKIDDNNDNSIFSNTFKSIGNPLNLNKSPKIELKFNNPLTPNNILNNASEPNAKINTSDGYKKFNNIPLNPDLNVKPKITLSKEEILKEKVLYLRKIEALEKKGIKTSKRYSMDSPLDEIKGEYELIKFELEKKNSVKFQGKMLMAFVSGIEYLNQKFDPFDVNLDGWGENVNESLEEYDDIFGELHEKYASKAKIAPEIKLLFTLAGSGLMVHMTNTMFKSSMPGMDDIMRQNPELMQQFTQAAVNTMSDENPGFGNFMQNMMPPKGAPRGPTDNHRNNPPQFDSRPDITMSRNANIFNDQHVNNNNRNVNNRNVNNRPKRNEMSGPTDLKDILSGLKTKKINLKDNNSTTSLSDLKEIQQDLKFKPKKSKRKQKSERNVMSLQL